MKILVIADIHGKFEKLSSILDNIKEDFDIVICPGDFTDMFEIPPEFSQMDIADIVLQKLLSLRKPLLCVLGNHDPHEIIKEFEDCDVNLHNKIKNLNGTDFIGFGGALTPFHTLFEPSEEEIKENLNEKKNELKENFVFIVHNPPKDTELDKIEENHVGSQAIREFILEKKPLLVISAHIHENKGTFKLGDSTVFYPGPAYEGNYGIVEIKGKEVTCRCEKVEA